MSDTDIQALTLNASPEEPPKKGRSPKDVAKLSPERVQATIDRVIQNRMRLMDRYNGIALFRDAKGKWDSVPSPGDIPSIQSLFEIKSLYKTIDTKEGDDYALPLKERVKLKAELLKQMTALCIHFEEQNSSIYEELQRLNEHEAAKSADGGLDIEQILKDAQG